MSEPTPLRPWAQPVTARNSYPIATALLALIVTLLFSSDGRAQQPTQLPPVVVQPAPPPKAPSPPPPRRRQPPTPATQPVVVEQPKPLSNFFDTYNPALELEGLSLPPGTIITTAGPVLGYRALSATSATKTATPIEQIPQSIQVLPRELIKDQANLSVTEAARNVSNVQGPNDLGIANTDQTPFKIRGFGADQWLDGLNVLYNTGNHDAFANVERIEVLKGPSAILYNGGTGATVGGVLNVISKLPTNVPSTEVGVTFGSHRYFLPYFDINQPLNKEGTVLFRITGEYKQSDSFIDVLHTENYAINPTLTLTNKDTTTLTIQGRISRQSQQAYQGLPVFGTILGNFNIDRNLFIGPSSMPPSFSEVQSLTVNLDHKFNSILSANLKARVSHSKFDQLSQLVWSFDATGAMPLFGTTWGLQNVELFQEQSEITINPSLLARFKLGETKNAFLVGADYSRVTDHGFMTGDYLGNVCAIFFAGPCLPALADLTNPSFPIAFSRPSPAAGIEFARYFDFENVYQTKGVYTQMQTTIYDRIHLLGGLRWAAINIDYIEHALPGSPKFVTDAEKVLPRAGIVVDLTKSLSLYTSYSEGMRWVGFSSAVSEPKPEFSRQFEVGAKFNLSSQLTGTVDYFEIVRDNVPITTSLGQATLSQQTSKGVEVDLLWQPTRLLQVLASYGYTDVRFGDEFRGYNGEIIPAGNRVPYVPDHSGRLWVNYKLDDLALRGWSVGVGVYVSAGQYVDNANLYKTGAFHTVDAKIAYETENFRAALNFKNLTGEEYWVPYTWLGGQVAPNAPRQIFGSISYKF